MSGSVIDEHGNRVLPESQVEAYVDVDSPERRAQEAERHRASIEAFERRQRYLEEEQARLRAERGIFQLGISISPRDRLGVDDPANYEKARKYALAVVKAFRNQDKDPPAEAIVDNWFLERRLDVLRDGSVVGWLSHPTKKTRDSKAPHDTAAWLHSEARWHRLNEFAGLWFKANPETELLKRRATVDAELQAQARSAQELAERQAKEEAKQRELERRANLWTQLAPLQRAFLRRLDDPEHGALFEKLAAIVVSEPQSTKPGEQPPRCAWQFLGIQDEVK